MKKIIKLTLVVSAIALFAGCSTPEQQAKRTLTQYGPYCEKMGYKKDTDSWRDCAIKRQNFIERD